MLSAIVCWRHAAMPDDVRHIRVVFHFMPARCRSRHAIDALMPRYERITRDKRAGYRAASSRPKASRSPLLPMRVA